VQQGTRKLQSNWMVVLSTYIFVVGTKGCAQCNKATLKHVDKPTKGAHCATTPGCLGGCVSSHSPPPPHTRTTHHAHLKISGFSGARAHGVLGAPEDLHWRAGGLRIARVLHAAECRAVHRRAAQLVVHRLHRIARAARHGGRHAGAIRPRGHHHAGATDRARARRAAHIRRQAGRSAARSQREHRGC
jgi:hypothetical protein